MSAWPFSFANTMEQSRFRKLKHANYCANPFNVHKKKAVSSLRVVSEAVRLRHPELSVEKGDKLCTNCRIKLHSLPQHGDNRSGGSEDEIPVAEMEDVEVTRTIQDYEIGVLNESLISLEQTPVSKRKLESRHYPHKKLRRVETAVRKRLEVITNEPLPELDVTESEMMSQLKEKFSDTESRSEKLTILTVLPKSWTLATIQEEFNVSDYMARQAKSLVREKGILSSANPRAGKSLSNEVATAVNDFYKSDAVSRVMPGKKDFVSVKRGGVRVHAQKYLVLCNLKEAYQLFKEKLPQLKIGFSKFAEMRPKECVLAGASGTHSVCVCTIHQNVKLMMNDSRIAQLPSSDDLAPQLLHYRHCLSAMQCNPPQEKCFLDECSDCPGPEPLKERLLRDFDSKGVDEVEFKQWTSTDRSNLETTVLSVEEFVALFCDIKLKRLLRHDFIARRQARFLQDIKNSLAEFEFLVVGDFAENYAFVVQDASQSFHWNNTQATLHPFVVYFREGGNLENCSFVAISECNTHDVVAVHLFQTRLVAFMKEKFGTVNRITYFSDGCAAQYKNCKNFVNLCNHESDFGVSAEWHFFATSHGKGPCDGIGGTVKRLATRASLQRPHDNLILTPRQFFDFAQQTIPSVTFSFTTAEEYDSHRKLIMERLATAKTVSGTHKLHSVVPVSRYEVEVKEFSHSPVTRKEQTVSTMVPTIPFSTIRGFVIAAYDKKWYLACVLDTYPDNQEVQLSFLHPEGPARSYHYPREEDVLVIDSRDILYVVEPNTVTGRAYSLSQRETGLANQAIQEKLRLLK